LQALKSGIHNDRTLRLPFRQMRRCSSNRHEFLTKRRTNIKPSVAQTSMEILDSKLSKVAYHNKLPILEKWYYFGSLHWKGQSINWLTHLKDKM